MHFENKVALVTGAASGIGKLTAEEFAKRGASVFLSDVNDKAGKEVSAAINKSGGKSHYVHCDVSKAHSVEKMVGACIAEYGKIDFCINNAGVFGKINIPTHLFEENVWENVMNINAKGVWLCMKHEIPQLLSQKSGVIVNIASVAGLGAVPGNIAYCASKHAVVGMTKTAALEYVRYGIRVNAVCPVFTDTPMVHDSIGAVPDLTQKMVNTIPMRRLATVQEIVGTIMFLCSDHSSFITGHALPVDGGMLAI